MTLVGSLDVTTCTTTVLTLAVMETHVRMTKLLDGKENT